MQKDSLGRFGIFARYTDVSPEYAAALESAGYTTIWAAGSPPADLRAIEEMLDATESIVIATGIVNIWTAGAHEVAASWHRIEQKHPGRFVLGIGPGHPERHSIASKPYTALVDYLDVLDEEGVPKDRRLLAALGPRVLQLAADRSLGAHPYLVTPAHTREARQIVGQGALLAPAQNAVITTDIEKAREIGRPAIANYLGLVNYLNSFRREGFTDEDFENGGSDRFLDAMFPSGDVTVVADALRAHLDAGADHVGIQLQFAEGEDHLAGYTVLAEELGLRS